jgi:ATP-binding protein involved in chromosome partitioning
MLSRRPGSTKDVNDRTPARLMTHPVEPLEAAVRAVVDPGLFHSIGELGLLRSVQVHRDRTDVVLAVPAAGHPAPRDLADEVAKAVATAGGAPSAVEFVNMTEAEWADLRARLHDLGRTSARQAGNQAAGLHGHDSAGPRAGPGGGGNGHGAEGPTPHTNPFADKASRTRVIAVSSGKGGVGKSTVTVNLAVALARQGASVAILDADVYGFSVPSMLGIDRPPVLLGDLLVPPVAHGVRCISMGFFVDDDQAVMWRGPMLHKALEQFLVDVHWGKPDFLMLDLPPGTGDVAMSIAQFVPRAEVLVVTTPQVAAERVAQRAAVLARQLRLPVRGVVENQSWFTGDDGKRYELFGHGGGETLAKSLGVALLGQIPFLTTLRQAGDSGVPVAVSDPEGEAGRAFASLAERVVALGPGRVYRSELSIG